MNTKKLTPLPCPFCGKDPVIKERLQPAGSKTEFVAVGCLNSQCHVHPHVGSTHNIGEAEQAAIRRWNIRG